MQLDEQAWTSKLNNPTTSQPRLHVGAHVMPAVLGRDFIEENTSLEVSNPLVAPQAPSIT